MSDNFGGISFAGFVFPKDVQNVVTENGSTRVVLREGRSWTYIRPGRYGVTVNALAERSEAGTLYNISCNIQVPRQYLDADGIAFCERMSRQGCVMRYRNYNGDIFVVGSGRFPLKCVFETLHPNSPGGFSGYKLTITGKQLAPQLRLAE